MVWCGRGREGGRSGGGGGVVVCVGSLSNR